MSHHLQQVKDILHRLDKDLIAPLVALAEVVQPDWEALQESRVTHADHFTATLDRAVAIAQNESRDDQLVLAACALTHDLCPVKRLLSSTVKDEFERQARRWFHNADGSARGTAAIVKAGARGLHHVLGDIAVINALHDAGSARFTISLSPATLHKRFIEFASLDTLGMLAWPKGGMDSGFIDGPLHSLWQDRAERTGDARRTLLENAQSVRKRQTALLGLPSEPLLLIECFSSEPLKHLFRKYAQDWKENFSLKLE